MISCMGIVFVVAEANATVTSCPAIGWNIPEILYLNMLMSADCTQTSVGGKSREVLKAISSLHY